MDSPLRGKKVQVRYNPFDLSCIQIWKDDERYEDAKPAELRSQRHSKIIPEIEEEKTTVASNYLERLKQEQDEKKRKELGTTPFAKLQQLRGEG